MYGKHGVPRSGGWLGLAGWCDYYLAANGIVHVVCGILLLVTLRSS